MTLIPSSGRPRFEYVPPEPEKNKSRVAAWGRKFEVLRGQFLEHLREKYPKLSNLIEKINPALREERERNEVAKKKEEREQLKQMYKARVNEETAVLGFDPQDRFNVLMDNVNLHQQREKLRAEDDIRRLASNAILRKPDKQTEIQKLEQKALAEIEQTKDQRESELYKEISNTISRLETIPKYETEELKEATNYFNALFYCAETSNQNFDQPQKIVDLFRQEIKEKIITENLEGTWDADEQAWFAERFLKTSDAFEAQVNQTLNQMDKVREGAIADHPNLAAAINQLTKFYIEENRISFPDVSNLFDEVMEPYHKEMEIVSAKFESFPSPAEIILLKKELKSLSDLGNEAFIKFIAQKYEILSDKYNDDLRKLIEKNEGIIRIE